MLTSRQALFGDLSQESFVRRSMYVAGCVTYLLGGKPNQQLTQLNSNLTLSLQRQVRKAYHMRTVAKHRSRRMCSTGSSTIFSMGNTFIGAWETIFVAPHVSQAIHPRLGGHGSSCSFDTSRGLRINDTAPHHRLHARLFTNQKRNPANNPTEDSSLSASTHPTLVLLIL